MEDVRLTKLKTSLIEAISKWWDDAVDDNEIIDALDTPISDFVFELMGSSAFNILLAQSDLTAYYQREDMLKDN